MPVLTIGGNPDIHVAAIPLLIADLFLHVGITNDAHDNHKEDDARNDEARMLVEYFLFVLVLSLFLGARSPATFSACYAPMLSDWGNV